MRQEERDERGPTFTETARRKQIMRGAIVAVNELGYHGASLSEIARHSGVAKSALVYYFGSKDALLLHVVDGVYSALGAAIDAAVSAESTAVDRLRAYAESYLGHIATHRLELAAASDIAVSHRGPEGVPLYLMAEGEDTALLREILSAGMDAGTFRDMALPVAVAIVENMLDLAVTAVQRQADADLETLSREIVDFVFRGLLRAPDRR